MKILIVDDEINIVELVKFNLELHNYQVEVSYDGQKAMDKINSTIYDLIILDVMLPNKNGLTILKETRENSLNFNTPILMLTAKSEESDIVLGCEIGADGYLPKPFGIHEFIARVKSLLRFRDRIENRQEKTIEYNFGNITINKEKRIVKINNESVDLTKKEFNLLVYMYENKDIVVSRGQLLDHVWGYEYEGDTRTVDVHIKKLRNKIEEDIKRPKYIKTIIGVGYKFIVE